MKKIYLFTVLLFQIAFIFGQETVYSWGPWVQNPCFKGLQSRSKVKDYNSSAKQYTWDIEIKNNYGSKVSFNFDIQNSSIDGRTSINAGSVDKSWTLNPSNSNLYVEFSKVCFDANDYCSINSNGTQNKGYKCFAECDNGTAKIPAECGNTTSTTTTQQNDLTDYNNSKAEIERQMAEKNAEIQRQNQENANKLNIWNNAIKAGVDAHNKGNYTQAKNQFTIAINNSTNEQNRQNAQNYYDKSVEAEKGQAKIKAVGDLTNATINLMSYFANRKNALRNSLSQEDGQALLDIVNSENPTDYTQNIIQIFTDLGYSHRRTDNENSMTIITMNNDINNINDFLKIFIHPASYDRFNRISFSYHRKEKLLTQLNVLKNDLDGYKHPEIKGVPPSIREKETIENNKKHTEEVNNSLKNFENNRVVFDTANIYDLVNNNLISLHSIYSESEKPTLFVTWARDWCNPCISDIEEIIKLELYKKINIVLVNVEKNHKKAEVLNWINNNKPVWFKIFSLLQDGDRILEVYDKNSAPLYLLINKKGEVLFRNLEFGEVYKIEGIIEQQNF